MHHRNKFAHCIAAAIASNRCCTSERFCFDGRALRLMCQLLSFCGLVPHAMLLRKLRGFAEGSKRRLGCSPEPCHSSQLAAAQRARLNHLLIYLSESVNIPGRRLAVWLSEYLRSVDMVRLATALVCTIRVLLSPTYTNLKFLCRLSLDRRLRMVSPTSKWCWLETEEPVRF